MYRPSLDGTPKGVDDSVNNPAVGSMGMDMRQWDVHQIDPSAHYKRLRDVESTSTEALAAVNGYSNHLGEREPLEEPDWKRRQHSSQLNAGLWDTSVKTTWWLAQQDSLTPVASMRREENNLSYQTNVSGQAILRDDELLLNKEADWTQRTEKTETAHDQERRGLGARDLASANLNQGKFDLM